MIKVMVNQRPEGAAGTGFLAYMDIGYADLVARLGEPTESDGFKVDAEWILEFPGGTAEFPEPIVATIYNYKTGRNCLGPTARRPRTSGTGTSGAATSGP